MTRSIARVASPLLLLATAGCPGLQAMFPRHEDVFIPLASSVGEMRVVGTDTSYVLAGDGYRVVTPDRDLLERVKPALDGVAASYRRYFGGEPRDVRVRLVPVEGSRRPDSTQLRPDSAGTIVVPVRVLDDRERARMRGGQRTGTLTRPVVRAWLTALGDSVGAGPAPEVMTGAGPRRGLPDWAMQALLSLITGEPAPELLVLRAAQAQDRLLPVRSVVTGARPEPDSAARERGVDPSIVWPDDARGRSPARGDRLPQLSGAALFDAEAVAIAEYIAQHEGRHFLGQSAALMATGATFAETLLRARTIARDVDSFEREWREWLARQAAQASDRDRE